MPADPVRTRAPSTTSRFRLVGKDDLLTDILGATESEAAHQAREIEEELRKRDEAAREALQAEESARRKAVIDALRLEEERRERARVKRQLVLQDIEEEEKRITGEYSIERDVRPTAPDTAQLAAAVRTEAPVSDYYARPESAQFPTVAGRPVWQLVAVPAVLLAGVLMLAMLNGGVEIDSAAYPKASLTVSSHSSPALALSMAEPERRRDTRRRAADEDRQQRHAANGADETDSEESEEDSRRRPLPISLDNAEELWNRGSEGNR